MYEFEDFDKNVKGVYLYHYEPNEHSAVLRVLHSSLEEKFQDLLRDKVACAIAEDRPPLKTPLFRTLDFNNGKNSLLVYRCNTEDTVGRPAIAASVLCLDNEIFKQPNDTLFPPTYFSFIPCLREFGNCNLLTSKNLDLKRVYAAFAVPTNRHITDFPKDFFLGLARKKAPLTNLLSSISQKKGAFLANTINRNDVTLNRILSDFAFTLLPRSGSSFEYFEFEDAGNVYAKIVPNKKSLLVREDEAYWIDPLSTQINYGVDAFYDLVLDYFQFFATKGADSLQEKLRGFRYCLDNLGKKSALRHLLRDCECPKCGLHFNGPPGDSCIACEANFKIRQQCPRCASFIGSNADGCESCGLPLPF